MKKSNLEHLEQAALFEWTERVKAQVPEVQNLFAIPNGAKLPYFKNLRGERICPQAKHLKAEGLKPGVPDIFLAYPNSQHHGFFIEMKSGKNKVTSEQMDWIARLSVAGYQCAVFYSWVDAANAILKYLGKNMKAEV